MTFTVIRIVFLLLGIVGATYIIPIGVAISCDEFWVLPSFIIPMLVSLILSITALLTGKHRKTTLSARSGYVVVAVAWAAVSLFGAVPLYFSGAIPDFTDAIFESVSGFTTTGSTILSEIETLPRSINLWRCQTHWLGGMGIVALTVALLPILGVGGFQLIKAETTGPEKGKLTPKIATTAKILWFMYLGLTVLETIFLRLAGMDFIDALSHSFSTLGTGGFSSKNSSIGAYNSAAIDWIIIAFMFMAGINFSLYYYAITRKFSEIRDNSELKGYITIVLFSSITIAIIESSRYGNIFKAFRYSSFQSLSVLSTAGFANADFTTWKPASQAILLALFFIGGSSGSTAGGVKVIRWIIMSKQLHNEFLKLLHPHGKFLIRINQRVGRKDLTFNVTAFFFTYVVVIAATTFFACLFNIDILTSFTGALTMAGNIGPGFNLLGPSCNFGWLPTPVKWWYDLVMIAGRLEFFTIIIFFSPSFWKK